MSDAKLIISVEDDGGPAPDSPQSHSPMTPGAARVDSSSPGGGGFDFAKIADEASASLSRFAEALSMATENVLSLPSATTGPEASADSPFVDAPDEGEVAAPRPAAASGEGEQIAVPPGVDEFDKAIGNQGVAKIVAEAGEKFNEFNTAIEKATSGLLGMPARIILQTAMRGVANAAIDSFQKMLGKDKGESGPQDVRVVNFSELRAPEGGEVETPGEDRKKPETETPTAEGEDKPKAAERPELPERPRERKPDGKVESPNKFDPRQKIEDLKGRAKETFDTGKQKGKELLEKGKDAAGKAKQRFGAFIQSPKAGMVTRAGAGVGRAAGAAGRAGVAGAARVGGAAAGMVAAPGGTGAVTAGLAKVAAVAGPAAIAVGGLAVAAIAAKKSWDAMAREVENLKRFSPDIAIASSQSEVSMEFAKLDRAKKIGPDVAEYEKLRGEYDVAMYRAQTEVKEILGDILQQVAPLATQGLKILTSLIEHAAMVIDLMRSLYNVATLDMDEAKKYYKEAMKHNQAALDIMMRKEEDNTRDDPYFLKLLDHAKDLGIDSKNLPPVIPPAPAPPQQPGQNP